MDLDTIELTREEQERLNSFERLGFGSTQALALATARDGAGFRPTVHDVRKTIDAGCDLDTAYRIYA